MASNSKTDELYIRLGKAAENAIDQKVTVYAKKSISLYSVDDEDNPIHDFDETDSEEVSTHQKLEAFIDALEEEKIKITTEE